MELAWPDTACRGAGASAYCPSVMTPESPPADVAEDSDEALMLAYGNGDAGAFDRLYARHKGGVYRYLLRQCREAAIAEELFQDVWMNLIRSREQYAVEARFTTFLYRVAHNRLVDHWRRSGVVINVAANDDDDFFEAQPAPPADQPEAAAVSREQAAQLLTLLEALPPEQREAFLLQQEGDLSIEDIAAATGVTRETAKSRLRYAMAKLRKGMSAWR
jgi:RNA polymerase sigma factor (sigma-70 family)